MISHLRTRRFGALRGLGAALSLALLAACADAPTAVAPAAKSTVAVNAAVAAPFSVTPSPTGTMLACPALLGDSATAVIGPRGGSVGVAGSSLVVPAGAVPHPTAFTFVVPASPFVQIEVHPLGGEHYTFARPVVINVSYARCPDSALPPTSVGAWWIDSGTRDQLGVMAGIDDRANRRLTFVTNHLSGYLVAY